ncbi:MAG: ABC transporter substrate-binding protein [Comamonadaceae bacterium]|nr:MAG: ABC transporter substrate-binding protein [Comamonadaceae bacterium]
MKTIWRGVSRAVLAVAIGTCAVAATAQVEYKVPGLVDFSGPFADLTKQLVARDAVVKWWNDNDGKKIGVKLTVKNYDTRYDGSVVASMWPGILNEMKPIIGLGLGGADLNALQQRLADDKVPMIYAPPAYGFGWLPNQWVFGVRTTYAHEWGTALNWYAEQNPGKRPVKVAFVSTQASPAFVDFVKGVDKYIKTVLEPKGLATVVATEWIDMQPVDVSTQIKKVIDAKADIIIGAANTTMAAAVLRAEQLHGVNIPTLASPWHTIWPLAQAMKTYAPWEGHMVVTGIAPTTDKNSKAWDFYQVLSKGYGLPAEWNPLNMLGISQGLLAVRAVEHAAKKVGAAKLTGAAVYDALISTSFTEDELMGVLPTISYTKEAPFPAQGGKVKVEWVKDGKYQLATPNWLTIPSNVTKW